MKPLLALLLLLAGCVESEPQITFSNNPSEDFEILDRGDGWLYVSNATHGRDFSRFRIKGKKTTWDDFDVEDLSK